METAVLIKKIIEGYGSEETITKVIELSLFVHEAFVENFSLRFFGWCKFRFELLSDNVDEKKIFLATMPEGIANNLCLYIAFLLISKYSS